MQTHQVSNQPQLYDQDYYLWLKTTQKQLATGDFSALDIANLVEELADRGKSEKRSVESNLTILMMHLLKYQYQPQKRSNSWLFTIREHRRRLEKLFKDSPSLKQYCTEVLNECYDDARELAAAETGLPLETFSHQTCFTIENILNPSR
ncbi:MAG: DUF29 family protein [Cyanobacteria bacterium]|jgi:hypothetical protein|nr:DUF29 family protein [Cyanobacteria bacterium GSL.Bin1]